MYVFFFFLIIGNVCFRIDNMGMFLKFSDVWVILNWKKIVMEDFYEIFLK